MGESHKDTPTGPSEIIGLGKSLIIKRVTDGQVSRDFCQQTEFIA